jgi:hypothetical protein
VSRRLGASCGPNLDDVTVVGVRCSLLPSLGGSQTIGEAMLYLNCATCGQPRAIVEVRAWILGAAFCSETCAQDARAWGRIPDPPAERLALTRASEGIAAAVALAEKAAGGVAMLDMHESTGSAPAVVGFLAGGLLGGMALDALNDAALDRTRDKSHDALWALDQQIVELVRRLMILHELGFPIATGMQPLVTTLAPVGASPVELRALKDHLLYLDGGIRVWLADA